MKALGSGLGVQVAVVVGGVDMMTQSLVLAKKPHVVIGEEGGGGWDRGGVDMMTQTLVLAKKPHVVIGEEGGDRGGVMIKLYRVSFSYSRTISGSPGEY